MKRFRLTVIAIAAITAYFFINSFITGKVKYFLENKVASHIELSYDDITLSTFTGTVRVDNLQATIRNKDNDAIHTKFAINLLELDNFSYIDYFLNEKIHFSTITIYENKLSYYPDKFKATTDTTQSNGAVKLFKSVQIDELRILDNKISFYDNTADSVALYIPAASVIVKDLYADKQTVLNKIPVNYSAAITKADSIIYKLSDFEKLKIKTLSANEKSVKLDDITIEPNFTTEEFSSKLSKERDHMSAKINQVQLDGLEYGFNEQGFYISVPSITVNKPVFAFYRDKLVQDDLSYKPLYSKSLRELPFRLRVDTIDINDGSVAYQERIDANNKGGILSFKKIDATLTNVGNLQKPNEKTSIVLDTRFQDVSNIHLDWSFNVADYTDAFRVRGTVSETSAATLNSFTGPNLHVNFGGILEKTRFEINGNDNSSTTTMAMEYDDFKINVLKDGKPGQVRKIVTAIASVFVKSDSQKNKTSIQEESASVERDKTKSVFNFIWISIQATMVKILI